MDELWTGAERQLIYSRAHHAWIKHVNKYIDTLAPIFKFCDFTYGWDSSVIFPKDISQKVLKSFWSTELVLPFRYSGEALDSKEAATELVLFKEHFGILTFDEFVPHNGSNWWHGEQHQIVQEHHNFHGEYVGHGLFGNLPVKITLYVPWLPPSVNCTFKRTEYTPSPREEWSLVCP